MATVISGPEISLVSEGGSSTPHARHTDPPSNEGQASSQGELDLNGVTQSSDTPVAHPCELDELEAATSLEWFRSVFSQVEKNGVITLKDFKHRAKKDVRFNILTASSCPHNI